MLTDEQLHEAYHSGTHNLTAALRRVEAAVRAQCAAELRASAAEWRNGHGDFGEGEAITLEIAACGLVGVDHDEWEAKQERQKRRRGSNLVAMFGRKRGAK